jgi:hypothetical protein
MSVAQHQVTMMTVTASGGAPDVRTTASVTSRMMFSFIALSLPASIEISTSGIARLPCEVAGCPRPVGLDILS